jgi:hypothetical protein
MTSERKVRFFVVPAVVGLVFLLFRHKMASLNG